MAEQWCCTGQFDFVSGEFSGRKEEADSSLFDRYKHTNSSGALLVSENAGIKQLSIMFSVIPYQLLMRLPKSV